MALTSPPAAAPPGFPEVSLYSLLLKHRVVIIGVSHQDGERGQGTAWGMQWSCVP